MWGLSIPWPSGYGGAHVHVCVSHLRVSNLAVGEVDVRRRC